MVPESIYFESISENDVHTSRKTSRIIDGRGIDASRDVGTSRETCHGVDDGHPRQNVRLVTSDDEGIRASHPCDEQEQREPQIWAKDDLLDPAYLGSLGPCSRCGVLGKGLR